MKRVEHIVGYPVNIKQQSVQLLEHDFTIGLDELHISRESGRGILCVSMGIFRGALPEKVGNCD